MELVKDVTERGRSCYAAAMAHGVPAPTARKWLGRYLAQGIAGLADRSSRLCNIASMVSRLNCPSDRWGGMKSRWDAIVIGSGVGGLAAAALLARVAGKRVLVLGQHSEPGGLTHVFRCNGASWDVGIHYVGELQEGYPIRTSLDCLSAGQLHWNKTPDELERFIYRSINFAVPSDPGKYEERLVSRFPEQETAIRLYFRDIRATTRWTRLGFAQSFIPRPLVNFVWLVQHLTSAKVAQTTAGNDLTRNFRSPLLRAPLASQWGGYGLPPSQSAFAIHAQIVARKLDGARFPEGTRPNRQRSGEENRASWRRSSHMPGRDFYSVRS